MSKGKHIHGKGIFDPNCAACRGICKCKKPKPSKKYNYCKECSKDLPNSLSTHKQTVGPKRKKILIRSRYPTIIDLAKSYGKTAMIQACRNLIRIAKRKAGPDKNEMESLQKDLRILKKTKIRRHKRL